jgi:hypothetical protein
MHREIFPTAVLFVMLCTIARADLPTTQPAKHPVDTSTPMAFLTSYDQLAGDEPEAYRAMYLIDESDDTQRLAQVQAKFDAEAGMLQKMVAELWGDDAVDQTLHALGLKTMRDVQAATIKEEGDRASVTFADGTSGPELIKTPQGWRLNLLALEHSLGVPVDDYLKQIRQLTKVVPDVADGIASGKLKNTTAVVSDIVKRINAN